MIALAAIAAIALVAFGLELAIACGIGRAIHHGNPVDERPVILVRERAVIVMPRVDRRV